MKKIVPFVFCLFNFLMAQELQVSSPDFFIQGQKAKFFLKQEGTIDVEDQNLRVNSASIMYEKTSEGRMFTYTLQQKETLHIELGSQSGLIEVNPMPHWMSVIPPILAILLAILFKEVLSALLISIFVGLGILGFYKGSILGIFQALSNFVLEYVPQRLADKDNISVILFCLLTSAMITVVSKNGGMQGLVQWITKFAKTPRSVQFATFCLGIVLFFDDYANSLIVGSTMRKVTDKFKVSREKLAYLVDSTAAPVTAIALITTWIGVVLNYIDSGVKTINETSSIQIEASAYSIFFASLKYSFYPIFTLIFIIGLIFFGRDFGPMYHKEKAARAGEINIDQKKEEEETYSPLPNIPIRAINGLLPILCLIGVTIFYLLFTGNQKTGAFFNENLDFYTKIQTLIGAASSFSAILMGAFVSLIVAVVMTFVQGISNLNGLMNIVTNGMKYIVSTLMILVLAWTIASLTKMMFTAQFLIQMAEGNIDPTWIPALTFVLAAITAFATGTSWGTMAILYPLIIPLTWKMGNDAGLSIADTMILFHAGIASVLAGAVCGDHCSPISDTTVLSSLATSCNHLEHVRTQMPYALTVAAVSLFLGIIPASFGISSMFLMPIGALVLWFIIRFVGKKQEKDTDTITL